MKKIVAKRQALEGSGSCRSHRSVPLSIALVFAVCAAFAVPGIAQTPTQSLSPQFDLSHSKDEIVRKLNRRISDQSSLPFRSDFVWGDGRENVFGYTMNFEPVISFPMQPGWIALTHVDFPVVYKEKQSSGTTLNLSDTEVTLLFANEQPRKGWTWGFGQFWIVPTATRFDLGTSKWAAGPATALVHENENWTIGTKLNHAWSFAGSGIRSVNDTFINPWITYAWKDGVTVKLESDSTYRWNSSQWEVPVEFGASKLIMAGTQPLNIGGDVLYNAKHAPDTRSWGLRFTLNLVFPK